MNRFLLFSIILISMVNSSIYAINKDKFSILNHSTHNNFVTSDYGFLRLNTLEKSFPYSILAPTISGNKTVCKNTPHTYTTEAGKTNYLWTVPSQGTIINGGTISDNFITVSWSSSVSSMFGLNAFKVGYTDPIAGQLNSNPSDGNITVVNTSLTLSGASTTCQNNSVYFSTNTGMANYTWSVSLGGIITSGGTPSDNFAWIQWNTSGANSVSIIAETSHGCISDLVVKNVTVVSAPTPTITGDSNVCPSYYSYYTETGGTNYYWSISGGGTIQGNANLSTITVSWDTPGIHTVAVSYRSTNNCIITTSKDVIVNPPPAPNIIGTSVVCQGSSISYSTETGMTDYEWAAPGAIITSGQNTSEVTITFSQTVPISIYASYKDVNGCLGVSEKVINVTPFSRSIQGNVTPCIESSNIYTTDTGKLNYNWTITGGSIISGIDSEAVTVVWNQSGSQTISVYWSDPLTCSSTEPTSLSISVSNPPTPTITGNITPCLGSLNFYETESGKSNYVWNVAGGTRMGSDYRIGVEWNEVGNQSISVSYSNSYCTEVTPTIANVNVLPIPTPAIIGNENPCVNSVQIYSTEEGMTNYSWMIPSSGTIISGGTSTDHSVTISWTAAHDRYIHVSYRDQNGCLGGTSKFVQVKNAATPEIIGIQTACQGMEYSFQTANGATNYDWSISPDGTIVSNTENSRSITIKWDTPGQKIVSVNYSSDDLCPSPTPGSIVVEVFAAPPTPIILGNSSMCQSSDSPTIYTTENGMSNYIWEISSGGSISEGLGTNSISVWWGSGSKTVSVNYSNTNGCNSLVGGTKTTQVNPNPAPSITGNVSACQNSTENIYTTEPGMTNYIWDVIGGTITGGGSVIDNSVSITWHTSGASVSVRYTDPSTGCSGQKAINVSVRNLPQATIYRNTGCLNEGNYYSTESGMSNYNWNVSGDGIITAGGASTDHSITVTWPTTGPKFVSVEYIDSHGCIASVVTNHFEVYDKTTPTLNGSLTVPIAHTNNQSPPYLPYTNLISYETDAGMTDYIWWFDGTPFFHFSQVGGTVWNGTGTHSLQVSYTDVNGCSSIRASGNVDVRHNQTISFNPIPDKMIDAEPFNLYANVSSGLPITYTSSNPSVATVSENEVTIIEAGTTTITASQVGNVNYFPASLARTLTINKYNQSITFSALSAKTFGNAPFTLAATTTSGLPVSYTSSNTAVATISGNTVTITGAGSTTITAMQTGNTNYNAATSVPQTLTVSKANQTITFSTLSVKTFGNTSFTLTATATSGLPISYYSSNAAVATISGNTVTITGAGSTTITASRAGDANYNAAVAVSQVLTVSKANQTISFSINPSTICSNSAPITLTGGSTSGLPIVYTSSNQSVATVSGNVLTIVGQGDATITASQDGDTNYNSALNVSVPTFVRTPATPIISGATTICSGSTTTTLTSSFGLSYLWSTGATTQSITVPTGTYSVTIQTEVGMHTEQIVSCWTTSAQKTVVNGSSTASITQTGDLCLHGMVTLTAGNGYGYSWNMVPNNQDSQSVIVYEEGSYEVTYFNTSGCEVTASLYVQRIGTMCNSARVRPNSVAENKKTEPEIQEVLEFAIYPNPVTSLLTIQLPKPVEKESDVHLVDQMGKVVSEMRFEKGEQTKQIVTDRLAGGMYLIRIETAEGVLMRKVMVVHRQ